MLMLMGFDTRFIISFLTLSCLCSLLNIHAMDDNSTLGSLDDTFREYAQNSLPTQTRTTVLYNSSLPANFTGIQVSIVRLRRNSFWVRGANYSSFHMPPRIFTVPYFTRLDIVYSNLGNQSSYYYNVPNYTLVAPVVGFNIYSPSGQIGNFTTPVTKLNLTLFGDPILVHFPEISLSQNQKAKCVKFNLNGTFEMTNMTIQDTCTVQDQGHFSIVLQKPSSTIPKENKVSSGRLWKWWVFGFAVGVLGLLLFGFIVFMIYRILIMKKVRKLEKQAEENEGLDTTNVGQSKMPFATVVRTQPTIESDYVP